MRKLLLCLSIGLVVALPFKGVRADEAKATNDEVMVDKYISNIYGQIDFSHVNQLSYEVFAKAYHGYLNLRNAGKLNNDKEILSICDFNLSSAEKRLWIIDLAARKVIFNTLVAHGQGSGEDMAEHFSNDFNSHQSSLGFYVTGDTYNGEHGLSLRLSGMDQGFNDAALDRGIVVHGANYVCEKFIAGNVRLGRSWGCPAVPDQLKIPVIRAIQDGTCLFIYHTDTRYQKTAYWVNKKVERLPDAAMFADVLQPQQLKKPAPTTSRIEYIRNGKVDSVVTVPITPACN